MKKFLLSPVWSILVLGLLGWLHFSNPDFLESLRLRYFDQLIVNQEPVTNNVYTVNIDEASIEKYGQWPWPRGEYAQLIEELYLRGAGLVVFNVLMSETDRSGQDEQIAEIMQAYPVIVTMLGSEESKNEPINPGASIINSDFIDLIPSVPGILANVPLVENNAVGSGITNTFPEIDGVTRRVPLLLANNDVLYPNVTMEVLRILAGDPSFQVKLSPLGIDKLRIPQFGYLQTDNIGRVWIDWSQGYQSSSAVDLPADFGGAVVFVGPTAAGITQPIATANGSIFPHELQAVMLGTVFNESNISRHPDAEQWAELAAFLLIGLILIALARWTYVGITFFIMSVGGSVLFSWWMFVEYSMLIDGFIPAAFLIAIGLVRYTIKFVDEFLQKQAIKKQFAGYASPTVVKLLQENPDLIKKGVKKEVSILFSDLRGFTPLGESFGDDVQGLTKIMNGYMDAITQPVLDNNGMIIKYIGDASMHIHNAPIDDPDHPATCVRTGLQMLRAVEKFNEKITAEGRPPVGMGAGINTGLGYIGEMGSTQRHSYDVLGDAVSTAARIESKCKEYGCLLLVGGATVEHCKDEFFFLKIDDLAVKGKTVGIPLYTVLDDIKPHYKTSKKHHDQMHNLYRMQMFDEAIQQCNLIRTSFDGKMEKYYDMWIERCEYMKTQNLPKDWDGIFVATTK
jgi:adenylate cyclase